MSETPQSPWTIVALLRWATDYFSDKGVSEPRASAEVLLAHALGLSRLDLYLRHDQPLAPEELARFKALVLRRRQSEPVAYITGHREFWSLDFLVNPAVLIPRPETEILIQAVLDVLKTEDRRPKTGSLDALDKAILNEIQSHFTIASRPYAEVGRRVGASEEEVLRRVKNMCDSGVIRRIGANFTSRKLGYTSTLCAASMPPEQLEQFAEVVNRYPGVTHNYLRRHHYNVWFTLIAESEARLAAILAEISRASGIPDILSLPAQKTFKIKVDFPV